MLRLVGTTRSRRKMWIDTDDETLWRKEEKIKNCREK